MFCLLLQGCLSMGLMRCENINVFLMWVNLCASLQPPTNKIHVWFLVWLHVCMCTKICILLPKWRHFGWSSQFQTCLNLRLRFAYGLGSGLGDIVFSQELDGRLSFILWVRKYIYTFFTTCLFFYNILFWVDFQPFLWDQSTFPCTYVSPLTRLSTKASLQQLGTLLCLCRQASWGAGGIGPENSLNGEGGRGWKNEKRGWGKWLTFRH